MTTPVYDQRDYMFCDDPPNADPDSWNFDAAHTPRTAQAKETPFGVRISVAEDGGNDGGSKYWYLYQNTVNDPATATQVTTTSSGVQMVNGTPTDGATCDVEKMTQAETWIDGEYCESDITDKLTLLANQNTEFQFSIQLTADASGTYYLFLRYDGDALSDHTEVPAVTVGAAAQNLTATGLDQSAAFGAAQTELNILAAGLDQSTALGTAGLSLVLSASSLDAGPTFGTAKLSLNVTGAGQDQTSSFGTATIALPGEPQELAGIGLDQTPTFGSASIQSVLGLYASGLDVSVSLGVASIELGLTAAGIDQSVVFGTHAITLALAAAGLDTTPAFGSALASQNLSGAGQDFSSTFGGASISIEGAAIELDATGLDHSETIGSHRIASAQALTATSQDFSAAFGSASIRSELGLIVAALDESAVFGTAALNLLLSASGLDASQSFGAASLNVNLSGSGQDFSSVFGSVLTELNLTGAGLLISPTFGQHSIGVELLLSASGLSLGQAFGSHSISIQGLPQDLTASGLDQSPAFGSSDALAETEELAGIGGRIVREDNGAVLDYFTPGSTVFESQLLGGGSYTVVTLRGVVVATFGEIRSPIDTGPGYNIVGLRGRVRENAF